MTYKLNPEVRKIESPILLVFPDGSKCEYTSGSAVAEAIFDKRYIIAKIRAVDDKIEIKLVEAELPIINWNGEESISFF